MVGAFKEIAHVGRCGGVGVVYISMQKEVLSYVFHI